MDVQFVDRGPIKLAGYVMKTSSRNGENLKAIPQFWGEYMNDGRMSETAKVCKIWIPLIKS